MERGNNFLWMFLSWVLLPTCRTHPFTVQFTVELLAHDPAGEPQRSMDVPFDITLVLNEDMPADPNSGPPFVHADSTVTWRFYEESLIRPSASPFVLFPDAAVAGASEE